LTPTRYSTRLLSLDRFHSKLEAGRIEIRALLPVFIDRFIPSRALHAASWSQAMRGRIYIVCDKR